MPKKYLLTLPNGEDVRYMLARHRKAQSIKIRIVSQDVFKVIVPYRMLTSIAHYYVKSNSGLIEQELVKRRSSQKINFDKYPFTDYKREARKIITDRLEDLNKQYGFSYNRIAIRNQSTRWGSCSSRKNLNFNYKIMFLPPELRDYVIVHELCHLKELNHSDKFWRLVALTVPEYRTVRKELINTYTLM